jgi:outer membrane protein assembly factor BamE (lipoprotein component of BamABCDE complex)
MRKLSKNIIGAILLLFMCLSILEFYSLDGIKGTVLSLLFKDTSFYASQYSDEKYRSIKKEMSKKSVHDILGIPLSIDIWNGVKRYHYSSSPRGSHYRVRQIHFVNDRVLNKEHYFYVD